MARQRVQSARDRLLEGLAVTERRLEVNGTGTLVLDGGQGPALVLLHGGIQCGGVYWTPVLARLARRHHLVVPDLPGLGESEPVARMDAAAFADWFAGLLRLTCEEPPILVVHSLVGSLAARFAARHGDLLRALVLYGTPGVGPYRLPLGLQAAGLRLDLRSSHPNLERFAHWPFLDLDRSRRQDPAWFAAFFDYMVSRGAVPHVKRTMRQLLRTCPKQVPDLDLRAVAVPTTLLWGRHDRMVPVGVGEAARARFGWPLRVVEDAGHVPHIEQPDAFVDALEA